MRRHLRRRGRGEARGKIRVSHDISGRPAEADGRRRLGDWEDDAVAGPGSACLVGIVGRASRLLAGGRADSRTAEAVGRAAAACLRGRPPETVTPDRGKEFANHEEASEALGGVRFYFCGPHHPWQKPTVENTNGLIREFFPKGTDFAKVTDEEVQRVYELTNNRPRKVLGYRTANEAYREMLHSA